MMRARHQLGQLSINLAYQHRPIALLYNYTQDVWPYLDRDALPKRRQLPAVLRAAWALICQGGARGEN